MHDANRNTITWRVPASAWLPITLAVGAETVSNGLRAYALGAHLERFTLNVAGQSLSLSGAVLVIAALAVSLTQAKAAWVALTPGRPARQRWIAGLAGVLLLAVSVSAMSSHILEAQRAKVSDEGGERGRYDRALAAYDKAKAELDGLGTPRPVAVLQALVASTRIDMGLWRRSKECADITRDDTREGCRPILDLYKERGAAARIAELAPEVNRLKVDLDRMTRPEAVTASEGAVAGVWAWIMGLAVVFIATFGSVIFAKVETATAKAVPPPVAPPGTGQTTPAMPVFTDLATPGVPRHTPGAPRVQPLPRAVLTPAMAHGFTHGTPAKPRGGIGVQNQHEALDDLLKLLQRGEAIPSQDYLAERWGRSKGRVSLWLKGWREAGADLPSQVRVGKAKAFEAA